MSLELYDYTEMDSKELEYQNLINKLVREGKLLSLFNTVLEYFNSNNYDKETKDSALTAVIDQLKIACNENLRCFHCGRIYEFHFCNNPILEKRAIELSCRSCNDIFTYNEGSKYISYLNLFVLQKIKNYKTWGSGISIQSTYGELNWPAVLQKIDNQYVLYIELHLVEKSQDVEYYWKRAKKLIANTNYHYFRSKVSKDGNKYYFL